MEAHRLSEVNQYIKQVIALNFEDSIWVIAEISQIKFAGKHVYLELIEKDQHGEQVIAQVAAAIWFQSYQFIKNKLGELTNQILQDGTQIQCKVKIDFHPKYGLKFVISDIDASYTFGQLELERQKTIERLHKEALIGKNKETNLPAVIQRIAVISSEKAAGLQDFTEQLLQNPYGYDFRIQLFQASVQGNKLEKEIIDALHSIQLQKNQFDCVAIIRGGGSKLDLSGFDSYMVAKAVANFSLPVITGIGHDIDNNVIELVAHSPLKTPTAAANFFIEHNMEFEVKMVDVQRRIEQFVSSLVQVHFTRLENLLNTCSFLSKRQWQQSAQALSNTSSEIIHRSKQILSEKMHLLAALEQKIDLSNPQNLLRKGYLLSYQSGRLLKKAVDVELNVDLDIYYSDGKITAEAKSIKKIKNNNHG